MLEFPGEHLPGTLGGPGFYSLNHKHTHNNTHPSQCSPHKDERLIGDSSSPTPFTEACSAVKASMELAAVPAEGATLGTSPKCFHTSGQHCEGTQPT